MLPVKSEFFKFYHWTLVGLFAYFAVYVLLSVPMTKLNLGISCPYYQGTGRMCPLCGITRDFRSIFSLAPQRLNPFSNTVALAAVCEIIYRAILSFFLNSRFIQQNKIFTSLDILFHFAVFMIISGYLLIPWLLNA